MNIKHKIAATVFAAGTLIAPLTADAQDFPNKAVTMVIPFGPGGSNDQYGRILAENLGKLWNQTVIVENKPGAGSAIGAASVAQSKPDGFTLLFVSTSYTTTAATQVKLPFDPLTALEPVGIAAVSDLFLLAGKRLTAKTSEEMKVEAASRTLFAGTPGIGSISHLTGLMLFENMGVKGEFVHHTSGANVMTDMGGGRLDTYLGVLFEATSGNATPIAVLSDTRNAGLPDVPTIGEFGFPDSEVKLWFGVFAPAGTPTEIVDKINKDITTVMSGPDVAPFLKAQALQTSAESATEFKARVKAEIEKWTALAEKNGLRK